MGEKFISSVAGYALFLAVNAISIWEAVFLHIPANLQTTYITVAFFLTQGSATCLTLFASMLIAYYAPRTSRRSCSFICSCFMILGCTLLVVAMYVPAYSLPCIFGGAMLIGVGCAAFFVIWQRFFSAQSADTCSRLIILGTGVAPAIYILIRLAPVALTAFLIPLVFVPLCGLSLLLSTQRIDFNQPMFEDNPRAHPQIYKKICSDSWKSALCVGSLGLADGAIRAIALSDRALESALGIGFMIGTLAAATAFFFVWRRLSFRFDIVFAFQLLFPFIITGFISLPFLGHTFVELFSVFTAMMFVGATMLMAMQCAQISRDQGADPLFVFGFYAGIVYLLQTVGMALGHLSGSSERFGLEQLSLVSMLVIYSLSLIVFLCLRTKRNALAVKPASRAASIEFIALSPKGYVAPVAAERDASRNNKDEISSGEPPRRPRRPSRTQSTSKAAGIEGLPLVPMRQKKAPPSTSVEKGQVRISESVTRPQRPSGDTSKERPRDNISLRCLALQRRYRLTDRETEVMELIARGNSAESIASSLVVSINTVRTHSRHIYAKLDIHKRQALLDMLYEIDENEL